ncbi:unnamed protein product [Allacma fusca]|uniref:CRAL-TRIO domain-containing protein n=1 Tax=Allacma fusca TaxID=39272 RepID=A0A8J2PVR9_9HEXA|nr:unnamed protein product [Allacma fusca]
MLQIYFLALALIFVVKSEEMKAHDKNQGRNIQDLQNWTAPENFKAKFPYYLSGYDYENRAIIVMEWGKWYTRLIAQTGGEELRNLEKMQDQFVEQLRTSFFRKPLNGSEPSSSDDEFVMIMDMNHYELLQLGSLKNIQYLMKYFAKFDACFEKFSYGFMINVSAVAEQFVRIYNAFMANIMEGYESSNQLLFTVEKN